MKYSSFLTLIATLQFLLFSSLIVSSESLELIDSYRADEDTIYIDINQHLVDSYLQEKTFFATYDERVNVADLPFSITTVPLITNVITMIWFSGKTYTILEMDEELEKALNKIREVVRRLYPNTSWNGELKPTKLVKNEPIVPPVDQTKEAALLFSGGADSTSAALELQQKGLKLLLVMMRGQAAHISTDGDELWDAQSGNMVEFARRHGHRTAFLTSNYHRFLDREKLGNLTPEIDDWRTGAIEDVGMFGMVVPILFSTGVQFCNMASSRVWEYPFIAIGNPLIDRLMSVGPGIRLHCSQFDLSRADKLEYIIKRVKEDGLQPPLVYVCLGVFPSCTLMDCRKCLPTAFTLFALSVDPREFGFTVTGNELIDLLKEYLKRKQPYISLWMLMRLRDKLRERDPENEQKFPWFFNADLAAHVREDYTGRLSLSWRDLKDLAPEDLEIPDVDPIALK